jgi:hypothetical protein
MLYVDPLKRITIPEIRQHSWFATSLPRYLAVPPPDTLTEAQKVRATAQASALSCRRGAPLRGTHDASHNKNCHCQTRETVCVCIAGACGH